MFICIQDLWCLELVSMFDQCLVWDDTWGILLLGACNLSHVLAFVIQHGNSGTFPLMLLINPLVSSWDWSLPEFQFLCLIPEIFPNLFSYRHLDNEPYPHPSSYCIGPCPKPSGPPSKQTCHLSEIPVTVVTLAQTYSLQTIYRYCTALNSNAINF